MGRKERKRETHCKKLLQIRSNRCGDLSLDPEGEIIAIFSFKDEFLGGRFRLKDRTNQTGQWDASK